MTEYDKYTIYFQKIHLIFNALGNMNKSGLKNKDISGPKVSVKLKILIKPSTKMLLNAF